MADAKPTVGDLLGKPVPALSATSDIPVIETTDPKPEAATPKPETTTTESAVEGTEGTEKPKEPDTTEGDTKDAKPKDETPAWMKAEITKERNKRRASDARADQLQGDLAKALEAAAALAGKSQTEAKEAATKAAADDPRPARPKRDTFDTPEAYDSALAQYDDNLVEWSTRQGAKIAAADADKKAREDRQKTEKEQADARNAEILSAWTERREAALEKYPDYEDVTGADDLAISPPMAAIIMQADNGTDLAYHLGKHPKEAERISKLAPPLQVFEMGRLATQLATPKAEVSRAAAPIKPLGSRQSAVEKTVDEMSMDEYAARHPLNQRRQAQAQAKPH